MPLKLQLHALELESKNNLRQDQVLKMSGNNKPNRNLKKRFHQSGQVLIESLLLMVLSVGLLGATLQYFRDTKTFSLITNAVWAGVAQMTEYGDWPSAGAPVHPNSGVRVRLLDPSK